MGKASSAKKIKRVQQAGASRAPGQRRQLGYPALITGILVVGLVLVALAVRDRRQTEEIQPAVGVEWFEAYGTSICGTFEPNFANVEPVGDVFLGADGLINIRPESEETAGSNAMFGLFTEAVGLGVTDTSLTLPDGRTFTNGDPCEGGEEGRVALYVWPPQAGENTEPRVITSNITSQRFTEDGGTYVLAFVPRGTEIPLPPSNDKLSEPDADSDPPVVSPDETTTTVAGDTTTTVAGDTTTTVAGDTTTTAPADGSDSSGG